jgi:WD40 repeat protein
MRYVLRGLRNLASWASDDMVRIWSSSTGTQRWSFSGHTPRPSRILPIVGRILAFVDEDKYIVIADHGVLRVFDLSQGTEAFCLSGHQGYVGHIAVSADGKLLASASGDRTVRVWDLQARAEVQCLRGHSHPVIRAAFSPDGKRIVSAEYRQFCPSVRVWELEGGSELFRLDEESHFLWVWDVAFSPDGLHLATASEDHCARLWNVESGELLRELFHEKWVDTLTFSADGRRLACRFGDPRVAERNPHLRIWDLHRKTRVILENTVDPVAEVMGDEAFPFKARSNDSETAIILGRQVCAWFPDVLRLIRTHPRDRLWAGARGRHLYLFKLEGG